MLDMASYNFITDRLAVGDVSSRAAPGFVAVVSLLATSPWDELYGAPQVPATWQDRDGVFHRIPVLHIDIRDGEGRTRMRTGSELDQRDLIDYLDVVTEFIAAHLTRGCVLVHCGAGISRSGAVAVAYLCRYAGMSYTEALAFVQSKRPCVAPADCFAASIKRWLRQ